MAPGTVSTTFHFLLNLRIGNKPEYYITLGQKGFAVKNTLAYCKNLEITKKMKCCEYDSSIFPDCVTDKKVLQQFDFDNSQRF